MIRKPVGTVRPSSSRRPALDQSVGKSWLVHLQDRFLWLLVASYALAAFWPSWGLALRQLRFITFSPIGFELTFASLLLSWLLFSAGLGLSFAEVRTVIKRPRFLIGGLAANVFVPLLYLAIVAGTLLSWVAADQRQILLTGLGIVAAVPIASSSTAWCQNANGNLALSLGLLLFSTLLSPFTTPFVLHFADQLGSDTDSANVVRQLSPLYTARFLIYFVLIPSVLGISLRWLIRPARIVPLQPNLKAINLICLLVLNYSNAAISLPQVVVGSENQFLVIVVLVSGLMCVTAFAGAWLVARVLDADASQRTALLFGMGMNNNGVGLVLASLAFATDSRILLPIIFYNLWQHLVAGAVDHWVCRKPEGVSSAAAS